MKLQSPASLTRARTLISHSAALPVLLLFLCLFAQTSFAQEALTGTVTNTATGLNLEGARIVMQGTGRETTTDRQGVYRFDNVAPGSVTLSVSYTGLNTIEVPVQITAGPTHKDVGMTSDIYTLSKFVVSGEREGNAQAITLQRNSTGIKSIVSADAFGGLAGNPADLAMRLPGVEGESVGGDYRYLRIRGMSQNLSTITQDGNRIADAGSAGATREFQFQTVGADSIERMEVVKSPTPDMDGDSIGGAVNLVSKSAFDSSPERRIRGSIGAIWRVTEPRDKARPNYSLSYSEVFGGKLGVAINLAYRPHGSILDGNMAFAHEQKPLTDQTGPAYTYSAQVQDFRNVRTRSGAGVKLDYKLDDRIRFFANWQYNKHIEHQNDTTAVVSTGQAVATRDAAGNFTGTGGIIPGYTEQITDVRAVASSQITIQGGNAFKEGETSTITVGGVHRYKNLNIDYDVYTSKSKANYAGNNSLIYTLKNIGFRIDKADPEYPTITQTAGPDWLNFANYTDNSYTSSRMAGWDEYAGAQINSKKQFETVVPTYIKAGYRYRDQIRNLRNTTIRTVYVGPDGVMGPNPATGINDDDLKQFGLYNRPFPDTKLKKYPNFPFPMKQAAGTDYDILTRDPKLFRENIPADVQGELTGNQNFDEKIKAYYVMGNVELGKFSVTGGVRVETTETEGEGALQLITPAEKARRAAWVGVVTDDETRRRNVEEYGRRQTRTGDYRTVLPGLHFKYTPVPSLVTRLSYATNIGRPGIGQLIPRTTVNFDNQSVSSSNPSLRPQTANNFDLSAEYYFEPAGQFAVGVFLKEIKNFIYTVAGQTITSGPDNGFDGDYAGYSYTTQQNGGFAKVKGIEVSYSQQFTFLPGFWNGFGAYANFTRMQAEGNYGSGSAIALAPNPKVAGFNPFVGNLGISYIKNRVSLRASYNYRGRYLTGYNANESRATYLSARPVIDIKTLFHVSKHYDVYLDVVNVTTTPDRRTEVGYGRVAGLSTMYPQFFFGINGRM